MAVVKSLRAEKGVNYMENINSTSEYQKVIDYIYKKIQDGILTVGSKLPTERAISEELGIGRNSTREALSILNGMGMIERIQGSGNYISKNAGKSIKQIIMMMMALGTITRKEVCDFRRTMEKSVCMMLIEKDISCEQKEKFMSLLKDMENADRSKIAYYDKKFHDELIISTENLLFITIMEAVVEVYREWIDIVLNKADEKNRAKFLQYHKEIFNGIIDKNMVLMVEAIDKHYDLIETMI